MFNTKFSENIHIFKCPLCGNKMLMKDQRSIVCTKNHCFDLAKNGYVNLLTGAVKTGYSKHLFNSRSLIIKSGLFEPLAEKLGRLILEHLHRTNQSRISILDAGCGEGSHLARIIDNIRVNDGIQTTGVGIDISKEGINIASRDYPNIVWCVADLSNVPFNDDSFNFILNILSPANYTEFKRLLTCDGILIKVMPGSNYLRELRKFFFQSTEKEEYSNKKTVRHFANNLNMIDTQRIQYSMPLTKENLNHLIRMTPLSWSAADKRIEKALNSGMDSVTVDLTIVTGTL